MNLGKHSMMLLSIAMLLLLLLHSLLPQFPMATAPLGAEQTAPNVAHFSFQHEQNCIFKYMANGREFAKGRAIWAARGEQTVFTNK